MRILSIGNMYPPHSLGGYEQVWRSATLHLRSEGHEVRVLTTDYRRPGADGEDDPDVHRELRWYWRDHEFPRRGLAERVRLERHNSACLERHLGELDPEVVAWWAMGGMSLSLVESVRRRGLPALGLVHDDWMVYGPLVDPWTRLGARLGPAKRALEALAGAPAGFRPEKAATWVFNSEHTRRVALEARPGLVTEVAYPGIDDSLFRPAAPRPWGWRLLYAGRIDERKGIATAIRALADLESSAVLAVHGGEDGAELERLRELARNLGLESRLEFRHTSRAELADGYARADCIVFPVEWEEPFGLVPLEAMAVGRPVVATGTGGSGEYLRHEDNCLLFPPGDAPALVSALRRLAEDSQLRERLRESGLRTAARYTDGAFNRAVEGHLRAAASGDVQSQRRRRK